MKGMVSLRDDLGRPKVEHDLLLAGDCASGVALLYAVSRFS